MDILLYIQGPSDILHLCWGEVRRSRKSALNERISICKVERILVLLVPEPSAVIRAASGPTSYTILTHKSATGSQ